MNREQGESDVGSVPVPSHDELTAPDKSPDANEAANRARAETIDEILDEDLTD